jgi:cytochrome c oxidase subunit 2
VEIPKMEAAATAATPKAEEAAPLTKPDAIIAKLGCGACHAIAGQAGTIGPNLERVGARLNKEALRQAVLDPDAVVAKGFQPGMMPKNYGDQLKASELEILVDFMASSKR